MKILFLLILVSCGKPDTEGTRCRSADEAQMKCQVDYAENDQTFTIPDYIKLNVLTTTLNLGATLIKVKGIIGKACPML